MTPDEVKVMRHAVFHSPANGGEIEIKIKIGPVITASEVGRMLKAARASAITATLDMFDELATDESKAKNEATDKAWENKADELEKLT